MILKKYILLVNKSKVVAFSCLLTFASLNSMPVLANPADGSVSAGSATITAPDANTVQVQQHSNKAVINWQSFNVAPNETVRFVQPSRNSIAVNRVNPGNGASNIAGRITANGQIWILNPAGVLITPTARIDVAGFLATTAGISDADFMNGNYRFIQSADWNGSVVNQGTITVADAGMAALVAPAVNNSGVIQANLGTVVLATGNEFVVDFYGDDLIHFTVNSTSTKAGVDHNGNEMEDAVSNSGEIIANGGKVVMAANTAVGIVRNNINMSGTVVAKTASMKNGVIVLSGNGGRTKVTGKLIASGEKAGEKGGKIKVEGKQIIIADNAKLDASGMNGGGEILMGGDTHGAGPGLRADYAYFGSNAVADASAIVNGDGGKVVLWSDISTGYYGNIYARGGSENGNGGFVETSGKMYLESSGLVDASSTTGLAGEWLLDPYNITISNVTANGSFSGGDPNIFTPSANSATVDVATINASLNGGTSVTIDTGGTGSPGAQAGDITLTSAILKSSGATMPTLTLNAAGTIALNNNITANAGTGGMNVVLNGSTITVASTANSTITTEGGSFSATAQNAFSLGSGVRVGTINTGVGTVTIAANADGASTQGFAMTATSSILTTNATSNAINVTVNTAVGGTGGAVLAGMTTGNGGGITVATNPGGNNGASITYLGTAPLNVGSAGTITLTTGVASTRGIGTTGANILISGGTFSGTTSGTGIFVTNSGTAALSLGTVNTTGAFTLTSTSSASIGQSGILTVGGITTIAAGASQDITLTNSANNLATLVITSGNNVSYTDSNALIMGASTISGNFNLTTGGTITQSGVLNITGTPTFTLTTATTDISLATQANNFATTPVITDNGNVRDLLLRNTNAAAVAPTVPTSVRNLTLTYNNATSLVLPAFSISGALSATANGPITQSGAVNVTGAATLAVGAANNITLTNAGNNFGTVTVTNGNDVSLVDINALILGGTISGALNVTTNGAITQSSALVVTGLTTLASGTTNNITLTTAANNFNTVQINSANAASVTDLNSIILAASTTNGSLTVTSSGAITQTGVLTTGGTATFSAGAANNITLDTFANNFATAAFTTGNNIKVNDVNGVILGTSTISGTLDVTAGGTISQSGVLTVTGIPTFTVTAANSDISLATSANNFTTTPVVTNNGNVRDILLRNVNASASVPTLPTSFRNLTLTFNNVTSLVLPEVTLSGTLSATANGAITQSGILNIAGTTTLAAGAANNITLTNSSNNFATVSITTGNNVSITDTNALIMAGTVSGILDVVTNGALTQSAALAVTGLATLNTNSNNITWNTSTNNFSSIDIVSGNNVSLRDANSLVLAGVMANGTLTVQTNGALTQTGAITAVGTTTLIAGAANDITLTNSSNDFGTVAVSSGLHVAITDTDDINLSTSIVTGTFGITAGGNITQSGVLTITGISTFTATSPNTDILLASAANVFTATPVFTNNGNIRDLALRRTGAGVALPIIPTGLRNLTLIYNNAAVALPTLSLTGALTVTAGDAITQTGAISGTTLTAKTLLSAGAAITLDNSGNEFTSIDLRARNAADNANAPGAISYHDMTGYDVLLIGTTTTASLIGGNAITQTGAISATTLTAKTLNNSGAAITFTNTANAVTNIELHSRNAADTANTSGALSYSSTGAINIAGISTTGTATLTSSVSIAQSGGIIANTLAAKTLRNAGGAITLNNSNNDVSTLDLRARNTADTANAAGAVAFTGLGGFDVGTIATTSTVALTAGGIITDSGAITGTTLTTSSVGGTLLDFGHSITGFTATNTTSGAIDLNSVTTGTLTLTGITQTASGLVNIHSNGSITANATVNSNNGNIVIDSLGTLTIGNAGVINSGTGSTTLTATSSITDSTSGTILAGTLNAKTLNNAGGAITLDSSLHDVIDLNAQARNAADTANAAGAIDFRALNGFNVASADTTSTVTLRGGDALTQTGSMTGSTLTATTLNNTGANITFDNSANEFANVNLQSRNAANTANTSGVISYEDASAINISGLLTSGNANIIANGAIADSGTIVVDGTLALTSVGGLTLNSTNSINALDITNNSSGNISFSANSVPLTIENMIQNSNGTTTISNSSDITVANGATFTNNGGGVIITVTSGQLSVGDGATIASNGGSIAITTNDLNLNSSGGLNSGSGNTSITLNVTNGSIVLGNGSGSMTISGAELNNITANNLSLIAATNGQIIVDGISGVQSNNIDSLTLTATAGTTGSIAFSNNASAFKSLSAGADAGINLSTSLTASAGNMLFSNAVTLDADVALTSQDITFNSTVNGAQELMLNSGASGNIVFNGNVGNITPLTSITVSNANNVTVANNMVVNAFTQSAGSGTTNFGSTGITTTGLASITTNDVIGEINVTSLALGTNFANLLGLIDGGSGTEAIQTVVFLNTITAGTHFFNGIDMYTDVPPTPPSPPSPTPIPDTDLAQIVMPNGIANYYASTTNVFTPDAQLITLTKQATDGKSCKVISSSIEVCSSN